MATHSVQGAAEAAAAGPGPAMDATRSYVTARTYDTEGKSASDSITPPPGALAQPQPAPYPSFFKVCGCIECYKPSREVLEYDYTYDDVSGKKPPQSYPRIRERGEFYIDSYNGEPWSCSFGTAEKVSTMVLQHYILGVS